MIFNLLTDIFCKVISIYNWNQFIFGTSLYLEPFTFFTDISDNTKILDIKATKVSRFY